MAEGDKEHHLQVKRFLENKKTTKRGDVNAIIQDFWMDCADTCNMDNINASLMESLTGYNVNQLNAQPSPPPSPPTGIQEEEWNRAHKILRVRTHMHMRTYYMLGTRSSYHNICWDKKLTRTYMDTLFCAHELPSHRCRCCALCAITSIAIPCRLFSCIFGWPLRWPS